MANRFGGSLLFIGGSMKDSYSILFNKIQASIAAIQEELEKYSLIFKQQDFFTFSNIQQRRDIYKKEYLNYITNINAHYMLFEDCSNKLSALLLEADRNANEEEFAFLSSVFNKCLSIEKELDIFTSKTEQELAKVTLSVSEISDCASRFLLALKSFCEFLRQV